MVNEYDLSIVIVNWNTKELLQNCISSIKEENSGLAKQIIVVDNNSFDGSREMVSNTFPEVELINSGANLGFAKANNIAIKYVRAPFVLILNPDTIVGKNTFKGMMNVLKKESTIGMVGCKIRNISGDIQELGLQWFPSPLTVLLEQLILSQKIINLFKSYLPVVDPNRNSMVKKLYGACFLIRKSILDTVGTFDERFFMYCEDVDLSYRVKANNWKLYYLADEEIMHVGGGTGQNTFSEFPILMMTESIGKYIEKYYGKFGVYIYRFIVVSSSHVRLFVLLLIKFFAMIWLKNYKHLDGSIAKYVAKIKWSLKLKKPIIKN